MKRVYCYSRLCWVCSQHDVSPTQISCKWCFKWTLRCCCRARAFIDSTAIFLSCGRSIPALVLINSNGYFANVFCCCCLSFALFYFIWISICFRYCSAFFSFTYRWVYWYYFDWFLSNLRAPNKLFTSCFYICYCLFRFPFLFFFYFFLFLTTALNYTIVVFSVHINNITELNWTVFGSDFVLCLFCCCFYWQLSGVSFKL